MLDSNERPSCPGCGGKVVLVLECGDWHMCRGCLGQYRGGELVSRRYDRPKCSRGYDPDEIISFGYLDDYIRAEVEDRGEVMSDDVLENFFMTH